MSWISIDIVSSTNLIQYHRERCPSTLTLKIDPFHPAPQRTKAVPPPSPSTLPPPTSTGRLPLPFPQPTPSLALSSWHVLGAGMGQIWVSPELLRLLNLLSTECVAWQWGFNLPVMSLREIFPEDSAGPHPVPWTGWLAFQMSFLLKMTWPQWKINKKTMRGVWYVLWVVGLCQMGGLNWQLIVVFTMELIGSEWDDNYLYLV